MDRFLAGGGFRGGELSDTAWLLAGRSVTKEVALLTAAGLTPLEALQVATLRPAEFFRATAWRLGAGRVVETGYLDSWRWRMAGLDGADRQAVDGYRLRLARLVAGVAYAGRRPLPVRSFTWSKCRSPPTSTST